ncbi:MAG: hypothetical protein DRO01_07730 [Thermoproteota archaeon]|nr:MAG: hypothetical protein DRO01_07730 [Candidatus Korarchaeota archaeon]
MLPSPAFRRDPSAGMTEGWRRARKGVEMQDWKEPKEAFSELYRWGYTIGLEVGEDNKGEDPDEVFEYFSYSFPQSADYCYFVAPCIEDAARCEAEESGDDFEVVLPEAWDAFWEGVGDGIEDGVNGKVKELEDEAVH